MTLTKLVNGVRINLTPEEETSTRAEWAENDQKKVDYENKYGYLDRRRAAYPAKEIETEAIYAAFNKMKEEGEILDPLTESWVNEIKRIHQENPKLV